MAKGFVHTVHRDGRWVNEIEGDEGSAFDSHETKEAAVATGREEAMRRKTEHVIHAKDGMIDERNSYGGDPAQRPG
jgi:Uncharacterized protein conserved in bacteria (DUF2188)